MNNSNISSSNSEQDFKTEELNKIIPQDKIDAIIIDAQAAIIDGKKYNATELIASLIYKNCHVYTTRVDEKSEVWIYIDGIYVPQGKTFIKEICRRVLGNRHSTHFSNDVIGKVEVDTYIDIDKFFNQNIVEEVPVKNGILNVITEEITKFTPRKIFFVKLPIIYDKTKACPNIKKHLCKVLKEPDHSVPTMFELFGYLLYKENKFEKAVIMSGSGSNGKGKTLELMRSFIGGENCSFVSLHKMDDDAFAPCELHRKMVNIGGDISNVPLKESEVFKGLTGRDTMSVQRKFLPMLHFKNYAKLIFSANQIPRPAEDTPAYWRRWLMFEFPYEFVSMEVYLQKTKEEQEGFRVCDEDIINKLTTSDELSGLLNKALISLKRLLKNRTFSDGKTREQIRELWIRKSSSFSAFIMDCLEEDNESFIPKQELKSRYMKYCHESKEKIKSEGDKTINYLLTRDMSVIPEQKTDKEFGYGYVWCWTGIRFKK